MSLQTVSQIVLAVGIILSALGGFGSYYFGKKDEQEKDRLLEAIRSETSETHKKVDLIYNATKLTEE